MLNSIVYCSVTAIGAVKILLPYVQMSVGQGLSLVSHLSFSKIYPSATIASVGKTATIIPVPKKHGPTELNYYRHVAL